MVRHLSRSPTLFGLAVVAGLGAGGCRGEFDMGPRTPAAEPTSTTSITSAAVDPIAADPSAPLGDDQIAGIAEATNEVEIDQAQTAIARSDNAAVCSFANHLLHDHTVLRDEQNALLARLHVVSVESGVSSQLRRDGNDVIDRMRLRMGPDFDRAYLEAQVRENQRWLRMIDDLLLPTAKNGEIRTRLVATRDAVATHLQEAQQLLDTFPPRAVR
jgi:putative membrane protein